MNRRALAIDVRDAAADLAVARRPSDLFRLVRRLSRLVPCLESTACAEAREILDAESAAQREFDRQLASMERQP